MDVVTNTGYRLEYQKIIKLLFKVTQFLLDGLVVKPSQQQVNITRVEQEADELENKKDSRRSCLDETMEDTPYGY